MVDEPLRLGAVTAIVKSCRVGERDLGLFRPEEQAAAIERKVCNATQLTLLLQGDRTMPVGEQTQATRISLSQRK